VVKVGEALPQIAKAFYGDSNLWPRIYQANVTVIGPDPYLLFPGKRLVIPDLNQAYP
jgi:nucleoid-associated protein YgaU